MLNNILKVVFIAGNFLSVKTGVRGACEDLSEKFAENKWKVITASRYKNRFIRMMDFLGTSWFFRDQYQVALVEVYSGFAFHWAELLCGWLRLLRKPYILTLHGGGLPEFAQRKPERIIHLLKTAKIVTTPSKYLQQELIKFCGNIIYLPNGLELSKYPYSLRSQPKPELIWLRAFHQIYNPKLAIEVLNRLVIDYPDTHLTMIGPDKGDGSLTEVIHLIDKYDLTKKVLITGAIPKGKVGQLLSEGDIFLNTTNYESFGVSTMEAAACGLCIITTNVGELSSLWEDGTDALLVPPDDPDMMALAVRRVLSTPGLAGNLSGKAHSKAMIFDWSIIFPQWEEILLELI